MTPKEKAKELVNKFSSGYPIICKMNTRNMYISEAKHCALIAVEEVRNFHYKLFFASKGSIFDKYLDNVVKEIEKL